MRLLLLLLCSLGVAFTQTDDPVRSGLLALNAGDVDEARKHLEAAIASQPDSALAHLGLARAYSLQKEMERAHEQASEAARLGKDDPAIQHGLAMFYAEHQMWADAAKWEFEFAGSDLSDPDAHVRAASMYLQADLADQAIQAAQAGIAKKGSAALENTLGKAYQTAGRPEQAEAPLRKAVEMQPYEESMHFDLGHYYMLNQRFDDAERAYLDARRYFDKSPAIELGLGIVYYAQRRFEEAVSAFLRTSELAPACRSRTRFLVASCSTPATGCPTSSSASGCSTRNTRRTT